MALQKRTISKQHYFKENILSTNAVQWSPCVHKHVCMYAHGVCMLHVMCVCVCVYMIVCKNECVCIQ